MNLNISFDEYYRATACNLHVIQLQILHYVVVLFKLLPGSVRPPADK